MTQQRTDWFVAPGLTTGDGTRERPFRDPWIAFHQVAPGDTIHVAAGTYFGRHERSSWAIDGPDITVLGGYGPDFTTRTPWATPTIFAARPGSKVAHEANMLQGGDDTAGLTLDGLCFDGAGRNEYDVEGRLRASPNGDGPILAVRGERITVRNCVFANGGAGAAELAGNGGRFENNLVVNHTGQGLLTVRDSDSQGPIVVTGNTFAFAHDDSDPPRGAGSDRAIGVRAYGAATIAGNVFTGCGNAAIAIYRDVDRVSVDRNLFFLTFRNVVRSYATSAEAEITDAYVDELEDVGLASAAGNAVGDPHLAGLPTPWVQAFTRDAGATYATPPVAALDALRAGAGLGSLAALTGADGAAADGAAADADPQPEAMRRLSPAEVLAIRGDATQGHHPIDLPVRATFQARRPVPTYHPIDWARLVTADQALAGIPVELRAGLGADTNITLLADPGSDAGSEPPFAVAIYQPGVDEGALYLLAEHHTLAERELAAFTRYQRGPEVEIPSLLRGTYRTDLAEGARQGATIVLGSVVPALDVVAPQAPPPAGHNWFVRAGSSGGDGSLATPFRDPFQALEKAEGGDTIHVATGEYAGRLRSGTWRIGVRNLTMLGGYSEDFATRDPWRQPVRFVLAPEEKAKGIPSTAILAGDGPCDGLVLDGFVFDGSTYNSYADDGSLDVGHSLSAALLDVGGGSGAITVRNCTFVNAASSAVQLSSPAGVFENNLVLNTSGTAARLRTPGAGPWVVRGNTLLFAADPTGRASSGESTSGGLLDVDGRAVARVDANVLAFADGIGVRALRQGPAFAFDGNVLAANLHADLVDGQYVWIDREGWDRAQMLDAPFGSLAGNRSDLPALPVDRAFAQAAIDRLGSLLAGLAPDLLRAASGALGVSPTAPSTEPAPEPETTAPTSEPSVTDLLADLGRMREELETADTGGAGGTEAAAIVYCPVYTWDAALTLVRDAPDGQPGVRTVAIAVAFVEAAAAPPVEYRLIDGAAIDADLTALDGAPIELQVTDTRSSATNTSLYPDGTTRDDHEAFAVAAAGGATKTRLSVVVRKDTTASKVLSGLVPTDVARVRGIGRLMPGGSGLALVADSVERL